MYTCIMQRLTTLSVFSGKVFLIDPRAGRVLTSGIRYKDFKP